MISPALGLVAAFALGVLIGRYVHLESTTKGYADMLREHDAVCAELRAAVEEVNAMCNERAVLN